MASHGPFYLQQAVEHKKKIEQFSMHSAKRVGDHIIAQKPLDIILDTCGFIELHSQNPTQPFYTHPCISYMTPEHVITELQRMQAQKKQEKGKQVCPFQLIANVYDAIAYSRLLKVPVQVDDRTQQMISYGMKKGNVNGNSRLSPADESIVALAMNRGSLERFPVIVSTDTDLPSVLMGMRSQSIGYMSPNHFSHVLSSIKPQEQMPQNSLQPTFFEQLEKR